MGTYLNARLDELAIAHPAVRDVRGRGLMIGVELADHDAAVHVEQEAFQRGLIVLTAGESTVRLSPALVVTTRAEIDTACDILDGVLATITT